MISNLSDALFVLDRLPDLVLLLDDEGAINYANRRAIEVLSDRDTLIGKQFRDLVDEEDLERLPDKLKDLVEWYSEKGFPWELRIRLQDGQMQLVSGNAELLTASESEANTNLQGILITLRLIGKPNSKNIRRDLLIAAVEAADSSIVIADMTSKDFPLIYVNQGFLQLTGYEEEEVIGQNCRFLQFYDDNANRDVQRSELEEIREAVTKGNSTNVVLRNYRKDGSFFYNDLYLTPVYERERLIAFIGVQNNITERVQTRQKFVERERIMNSFFAATDALIGIVELPPSEPIRHRLLNDRAAEFFQVESMETQDVTIESLDLTTEIKTQWQSAFEQCWQTQEVVKFDCSLERSGEPCYLQVTINPIKTESEAVPCCCYVAEDVTDLNIAQTHLRLMKAAVENIHESVVVTQPGLNKDENQPKIIYVNKAFTKMTGYKPEEAIGKTPRMLQGDLTDPAVLERLRKSLSDRQSFRGETINYRKDGQPFIIEWNIASIQNEDDKVAYWVAAQRDVTRRRQLEKEVLEIQAREQERIARDLHDSVQQKLNVVVMVASLIQHQLDGKLTPQLKGFLDRLLESSRQASKEVRDISHSLHSVNIEKSGLMTALQHLSTTTKEVFDVHCEFTYEQPVLIDEPTKATHLYRIVQEAVNNAIRHGKATQILIGLARVKENRHTLTISDNGIGISTEVLQNKNKGMGLNSMRYRAEFIEADLAIERGEEGGTVVTCIFDCRNISSEIDSLYNNSDLLKSQ